MDGGREWSNKNSVHTDCEECENYINLTDFSNLLLTRSFTVQGTKINSV